MIIPADNADDSAKQDVADSPVASTLRYTESKLPCGANKASGKIRKSFPFCVTAEAPIMIGGTSREILRMHNKYQKNL